MAAAITMIAVTAPVVIHVVRMLDREAGSST